MYIPLSFFGEKNSLCKNCTTIRFTAGGVTNYAYYVPCGTNRTYSTTVLNGRSVEVCIASGSTYSLTGGGGSITNLGTSCSCVEECDCINVTFSRASGTGSAVYKECGKEYFNMTNYTAASPFTVCLQKNAYYSNQVGGTTTINTDCNTCSTNCNQTSFITVGGFANGTIYFIPCGQTSYKTLPTYAEASSPGFGSTQVFCVVTGSAYILQITGAGKATGSVVTGTSCTASVPTPYGICDCLSYFFHADTTPDPNTYYATYTECGSGRSVLEYFSASTNNTRCVVSGSAVTMNGPASYYFITSSCTTSSCVNGPNPQ